VVKDVPPGATVVGLAGRILDRERAGPGRMKVGLSESEGDHHVQVMEVLLGRVEQLERRVGNGSAARGPNGAPGEIVDLVEGGGI
jgi:hypothetical protein